MTAQQHTTTTPIITNKQQQATSTTTQLRKFESQIVVEKFFRLRRLGDFGLNFSADQSDQPENQNPPKLGANQYRHPKIVTNQKLSLLCGNVLCTNGVRGLNFVNLK